MTDLDQRFTHEAQFRNPDFAAAIWCWGCSFTWGQGLNIEDTWPYLLSQKLMMPTANLGVIGSSVPRIWRSYSLLRPHWSPRLSIFSWPTLNRSYAIVNDDIVNLGVWNSKEHPSYRFKLLQGHIEQANRDLIHLQAKPTIQEPSIHFALHLLWPQLEFPDRAKDGVHPGKETNRQIADYVLEQIKLKAPLLK